MKNYLLFGFGVMSLWSSGLFGSDTDDYAEPRRTRNRDFRSIEYLHNSPSSGCIDFHVPRSCSSEIINRILNDDASSVGAASQQKSPILVMNERGHELLAIIHQQSERMHEIKRTIIFLRLALVNHNLNNEIACEERLSALQNEMSTLRSSFIANSVELESFIVPEWGVQ